MKRSSQLSLDFSRERKIQWITAAFITLLSYAALSKLMDYEAARRSMMLQVFKKQTALVLAWLVPVSELIVVTLLLIVRTRTIGLWAATLLMLGFSCYLILANVGWLGRVPCACGGILGKMDYGVHLAFNLLFVILGSWGIFLSYRKNLIHKGFDLGERRKEK